MVPRQSSDSKKVEDRLRASRLGAESVKASFGAFLTRRRYAELVGVSVTTVRRWERVGVVVPHTRVVLNSPTTVFEPEDVDFGRRLAAVIRARPGELSLTEAAAVVRGGAS
jgi:hypothetical protein